MKQAMFQAIASTLIYGKQDAVLVDAFMTVKQADALVDWVAASGKNLTTIYITHGHGDHWFGSELFLNASQMLEQLRHLMLCANMPPQSYLKRSGRRAFRAKSRTA
jgi:glyoxylase-like metal-dependent hydrolase (beta-lactamase superfamily II)